MHKRTDSSGLRLASRFLLALLALVVLAPEASAISDVKVNAQETSQPNTFALEASAIVDASPLAARHVILRQCQDKNLSHSLKYCRMFKKDGKTTWNYSVSQYPLLSPRDVVLERTITSDLDEKGQGIFRMEWKLAAIPGMGEREDHIRPSVYEGYWIVEPIDGGKRSRATYRSALEPGGYIPVIVMKWATRHGIPATLERLEEVAMERDKKGGLLVPHKDDPWAGMEIAPMDPKVLAEMAAIVNK